MEIWKKGRIAAFDQQVQVGVEEVTALASSRNMEEQMQVGVDVGETYVTNVSRIEVELQKTIDMIEGQEL
jgi:hypothetical protein